MHTADQQYGPCSCQDDGRCLYVNGGPACMNEQQGAPTPRVDALLLEVDEGRVYKDYGPTVDLARQLERELAAIREALTGEDYASLPSDIPTVRMAHEIRSDRDKFLQQVRDTCSRAEKAERELSAAKAEAERLREALKQAHDAMEAFTDPEGNMPERTGEFNDLKRALQGVRAALAATRKENSNG